MYLGELEDTVEELGGKLSVVNDENGNEASVEVLIGTVKSRGTAYEFNKYSLGIKGYAIKAFDESKIAIAGGGDESLTTAVHKFFEEYLGLDKDAVVIDDFVFTSKKEVMTVQDDYEITSITINGNDIEDYKISRDSKVSESDTVAKTFRSFLYESFGVWLPMVEEDDTGDKNIRFKIVGKDEAGDKGFRVRLDGNDLVFECGFANMFPDAFEEYFTDTLKDKTGVIALGGYTGTINLRIVSYSDPRFGIAGDGVTDDYDAIRKLHEFANNSGQDVIAEPGKTYYIGESAIPIPIKTNVDWTGVTFIFDDTNLKGETGGSVFSIEPDTPNSTIGVTNSYLAEINEDKDGDGIVIKGVEHGDDRTKKLDLGLGYPALLNVVDGTTATYLRWGYVDSQGGRQVEIVLIDAEGNIDPSTPLLHDYKTVTSITVQRLDNVTPITVKGATIITRATKVHNAGNISRNIIVKRPYATIDGIIHKIEGEYPSSNSNTRTPVKRNKEGLWEDMTSQGYSGTRYSVYYNGQPYTVGDVVLFGGVTYTGIINVSFSESVTVKNCVFQAKTYYGSGTYDLNLYNANNTTFINCTQSNYYTRHSTDYNGGPDSMVTNLSLCWGIMGSNDCKNLNFDECMLTRFDAHHGVYNATIKNSMIGVVRLIGGGTFTLDNVTLNPHGGNSAIQLRSDYGATFNGTVILKDCTLKPASKNGTGTISPIIDAPTANWRFGYNTFFPNVIIDNLTLEGTTQTSIDLVSGGSNARNLLTQNVHDPNAIFAVEYKTADRDIVKKYPERFPYLNGLKEGTDYTIVGSGNSYTIMANLPNINPYSPPNYIEIKNMTNFKNVNGQKVSLNLYDCNFFTETRIIDNDSILVRN